jgi:hypothetical protein
MDEDVGGSLVWLDEAVAFPVLEELHATCDAHFTFSEQGQTAALSHHLPIQGRPTRGLCASVGPHPLSRQIGALGDGPGVALRKPPIGLVGRVAEDDGGLVRFHAVKPLVTYWPGRARSAQE